MRRVRVVRLCWEVMGEVSRKLLSILKVYEALKGRLNEQELRGDLYIILAVEWQLGDQS